MAADTPLHGKQEGEIIQFPKEGLDQTERGAETQSAEAQTRGQVFEEKDAKIVQMPEQEGDEQTEQEEQEQQEQIPELIRYIDTVLAEGFPTESYEHNKDKLDIFLKRREEAAIMENEIYLRKLSDPQQIFERVYGWLEKFPHIQHKDSKRRFDRFLKQEALNKSKAILRLLEEGRVTFVEKHRAEVKEFVQEKVEHKKAA